MGPVAVTLLATLLPTGFLIVALLCFSCYLYSKLRASRDSARTVEEEVEPAGSPKLVVVEDMDWTKRRVTLSDAADPDWFGDAIEALVPLSHTGLLNEYRKWDTYNEPGDEAWAAELLAELGYTGELSVPAILCLLRQHKTQDHVVDHIIVNVVIPLLSLEGDNENSLLPFTPEQHRSLLDLHKALESKKCKSFVMPNPHYIADSLQCPRIVQD